MVGTPRQFDIDFLNYRRAQQTLRRFWHHASKGDYFTDRHDPRQYLLRTRWLLHELDDPDRHLRFVHVTGTAGKGTVSAMIARGLMLSGKKTGWFHSPEVVTQTEQIQVNGEFIGMSDFTRLVDRIVGAIRKRKHKLPYGTPSAFEIFYVLSVLYFVQEHCDWVVQEVGLGGRFDATNVIEHSEVSVITNIDLDHTEILGHRRSTIARDKAGIIKPHSHFFTSEPDGKICEILRDVATSVAATYHLISSEGEKVNVALAKAVLRHLRVDRAEIATAIKTTWLPCRYEIVRQRPRIILDGAHNNRKMRFLLRRFSQERYRRLFVIAAFWQEKPAMAMARALCRYADVLYLPHIQSREMRWRRCFDPKKLKKTLGQYGSSHRTVSGITPLEALGKATEEALPNDCILITGSFTLCAQVRAKYQDEKEALLKREWRPITPSSVQRRGRD